MYESKEVLVRENGKRHKQVALKKNIACWHTPAPPARPRRPNVEAGGAGRASQNTPEAHPSQAGVGAHGVRRA